jgi:mRNA interferase MazF
VRRGDVYLANLNPVKGSEQAGQRPVLIYQNNRLLQVSTSRTVVVIPFTTNLKLQYLPSCLLISAKEGGLRQDSVALCHQIRALDKSGLISYWGSLPASRLGEIDQVVLYTVGVTQ